MDIRFLLGLGVALSAVTLVIAESPIPAWLGWSWRKTVSPVACAAFLVCLFGLMWALLLHDTARVP